MRRKQHLKIFLATLGLAPLKKKAKAGIIVKIFYHSFCEHFKCMMQTVSQEIKDLIKAATLFSLLIVKCTRKDIGVGTVAKNITHYRMYNIFKQEHRTLLHIRYCNAKQTVPWVMHSAARSLKNIVNIKSPQSNPPCLKSFKKASLKKH
jgi:hypothetical protein